MSSAQELKALLAPLRVYDLDAPFNGAELNAMGAALDTAQEELTTTEREMLPRVGDLSRCSGCFPTGR